jgi:hypothetical protein
VVEQNGQARKLTSWTHNAKYVQSIGTDFPLPGSTPLMKKNKAF